MKPLSVMLLFALITTDVCAEMVIIEGGGYEFDVIETDQTKIIATKTRAYLDNKKPEINGVIKLNNPPEISTKETIRRVDVTYTFQYDIADKDGKILSRAGDTVNPLTTVTMPDLVIVDGRSEEQLLWAQHYKEEKLSPTSMIVLSGGNWIDARKMGVEAYRLSDRLQQRLQITHVPCVVSQDGKEVVIHEYNAEDL